MNSHQHHAIVVGVDGSPTAHAALAHGAWEAHRRRQLLRLVHCQPMVTPYATWGVGPNPVELADQDVATRALLDDALGRVQLALPELRVETTVLRGNTAGLLVDESADADLIVVGSRGLGGFSGLLVGSVSEQLAAHSRCPVIVVRPDDGAVVGTPASGPVVVGIDGVREAEAALAFAFDQASGRGVPLLALYAWWMVSASHDGPFDLASYNLADAEQEARRLLAEAIAGWREKYPDVEVALLPAHALNPTQALIEASQNAALLVVSRHGGNAMTRLLLGSIGDMAVRKAASPVAVVPEPVH
jgi:nucleotide-binding universal stress UspA family protein